MAIAVVNLGASSGAPPGVAPDINSGTDATSYTGSSFTPPTDGIALAFAHARRAGVGADTPVLSGWGLTWTQIGSTLSFVTDYGIALFASILTGATVGALTANYSPNTEVGCILAVCQATGVDVSGGLAAAFVQQVTATGLVSGSGSITLASAGSADNRPVACFGHDVNEDTTPRTNWNELDDMKGAGHPRAIATQYRNDAFETTASASWTTATANWGGMAVELKAAATGRTTKNTDPRPVGQFSGVSRTMINPSFQIHPNRKFFIPARVGA